MYIHDVSFAEAFFHMEHSCKNEGANDLESDTSQDMEMIFGT